MMDWEKETAPDDTANRSSNRFSAALHRRVDELELSSGARDRILTAARRKDPFAPRLRPALALAAAACLLLAVVGVAWLARPAKPDAVRQVPSVEPEPRSFINCTSVTYASDDPTDWLERTIVVRTTNGKESYIKITATRPRKEEEATS